jgi:hypothetical protein
MTDAIFDRLSPRFDRLHSKIGRPSIPPEKLLRALLLRGLCRATIESGWGLMKKRLTGIGRRPRLAATARQKSGWLEKRYEWRVL